MSSTLTIRSTGVPVKGYGSCHETCIDYELLTVDSPLRFYRWYTGKYNISFVFLETQGREFFDFRLIHFVPGKQPSFSHL